MPFFFETIMEAIEKGTVPPFERDSVMCLRKFEEVVNKTMAEKDQTIADLRAQLAELAQCRDHWKTSYEDVRAQLKQAEKERDELRTKGAYWETLVRSWPESLEARLAAKDAELADLRNWKESAMTVLSKIDLQAIGKEIGVRLGHDVSPEILPWIRNTKAELAERNRELDDAVENLKVLGQQQMDDHKAHKAEVERYRKAVEPVKAILGLKTSYDNGVRALNACDDCIRTLGEAGNERD